MPPLDDDIGSTDDFDTSMLSAEELEGMGLTPGDDNGVKAIIEEAKQPIKPEPTAAEIAAEKKAGNETVAVEDATGKKQHDGPSGEEGDDGMTEAERLAQDDDAAAVAEQEAAEAARLAAEQAANPAAAATPAPLEFDIGEFKPNIVVPPPVENLAEQLAALRATKAEQKALYLAGEIDDAAMEAAEAAYEDQASSLRLQHERHVDRQQQLQEASDAHWQEQQRTFNQFAIKDTGIDYSKDVAMNRNLDDWVKRLADKDENADKPLAWFLAEAHKKVCIEHGKQTALLSANPATAAKAAAAAAPAAAKPAASRAPNLANIPPTLGRLPAAGEGEANNGEFSRLDQLRDSGDVMAYEDTLARMSQAEQDRYLASN